LKPQSESVQMKFLITMWGDAKDWAPAIALVLSLINLIFLTFQLVRQNKISKAQLLKDRFEMYWKIYSPITDDEIDLVHACPDDFMPMEKYKKIKGERETLRKYVLMSELFEYLAFTMELKSYGIEDTFGPDWVKLWTRDLKEKSEFMEVKDYYREYYPRYAAYVDELPPDIPAHAGALLKSLKDDC
jgi:hypothetical protein